MNSDIYEVLESIENYLETAELVHDLKAELVEEKKTREEYAKKKFLKKHDYDNETGTVDVGDGRRVRIDTSSKNIQYIPSYSPKNDGNDGIIELNKKFFKLKNSKRREGIFQHEVGHGTLHVTGSNIGKRDTVIPEVLDRFDKSSANNTELNRQMMAQYMTPSEMRSWLINDLVSMGYNKDRVNRMTLNQLFDLETKYTTQSGMKVSKDQAEENAKINSERVKMYNHTKKYVGTSNEHEHPIEIEADRYAANHTKGGSNTYKKALNELNKHIRKDYKRINNEKDFNNITKDENMRRNRALNDKTLKRTHVYD